jgi:hypothetical protein
MADVIFFDPGTAKPTACQRMRTNPAQAVTLGLDYSDKPNE